MRNQPARTIARPQAAGVKAPVARHRIQAPGTIGAPGWSNRISRVEDRLHVHDLHATLLHLFGIDHERLTYRFQGRRYRLTDVHGRVISALLA